MWRLKTSEGTGPWLRSTKGFLGRQVWEFDPDAGTAEERAEVTRLRDNFTEHRFEKKESQDLLMRLQYAKLNLLPANIPMMKLGNYREVTEQIISRSLRKALNKYSALQAHDGHWPGDYSGVLFIMPILIFSLYVTRSLNIVLSPEHQREICRHIYNHQNEDGGWGINVISPSTMLGSCLNYAALRLLGEMLDNDSEALKRGRAWIISHGSATTVPQWGKIFLSIIGAYEWSGNNPIIPELWLLPSFLPIHPGRFWCFCRLVYMAMAYLYGKKFVGPITPTILELREELYNAPYENIDWKKERDSCAKEDRQNTPSHVQTMIFTFLNNFVEPVLNFWPTNKLRKRALDHLMEHIHYNDETTEYITICPVDKALNMICCWIENPNSNAFHQHLPRIHDYLWLAEDGMKAKIYDGCQGWEMPFIVQAFCSTDLIDEFSPTIKKAHQFVKKSQVLANFPSYQRFYRHRSKGSWTLSTVDNGWSVSDCTAEAVKALLLLSKRLPDLVGDPIEDDKLYDAIDCLLSFMNKDGSFAAYECKRTYSWLEILNPSGSFKNIIIDYPSVESTASVLDALMLFKEIYPQYRSQEIGKCIKSATMFIQSKQRSDGSWYGNWGICFTYGTFFAVKALSAARQSYNNSSSMKKACDFLLSKQQSTGGWGESYLSYKTAAYIDSRSPQAVNTAWAMLALIYAGQAEIDPVPLYRGAQVLMNMQLDTGEFPQQYAKLNLLPANIPMMKLGNYREVTEQIISRSLRKALNKYSALQAHDGHWPGDYSGVLFIMPILIFSLYVTRSLNIVLSPEHQREICRHIYNHQNEDGGWGINVISPSTMLGSCLNYAALRLLGEMLDNDNEALKRGRAWIISHGSATTVPQWGKIFLLIIGAYEWSGNNPIIPELWLLPSFLPIHPGRFWCFCRLVYMAMAYLYGKKFVGPITPTILELREELYNAPYENIDWKKERDSCAKEDRQNTPSHVQTMIFTFLNNFVEPVLNFWPTNKLRKRALDHLMEHIHYNDETTEYITICPVDKALNMICCWIENPNSNAFHQHLPRIHDYLWLAEDGMKAKIYDGCQGWEMPFIVQAFCSTDLIDEFSPTIKKAHQFVKKSQVLANFPSYQRFYRHRSKGSWTLSTVDNGWSVSDCTAEAVKALLLLSKRLPDLVGDPIEDDKLYDAIDCLLSFMNKDGSFAAYECKRTYSWLEILNPSGSFKNIIIDYPSVESTASVLDALMLFKEIYPQYRSQEIGKCIKSATMFIQSKQRSDGSWYGNWGICFTYGTFFAVKALSAARQSYNNSSSMKKACDFLLSKQQSTGGWGESYLSYKTAAYIDSRSPQAVNTAWAMLALIYAGQAEIDPVPLYRGAQVLMNMQLDTGEFPQQEHAGCANSAFYFNYPNYRNIFPIWALGEFRRRIIAGKNQHECA